MQRRTGTRRAFDFVVERQSCTDKACRELRPWTLAGQRSRWTEEANRGPWNLVGKFTFGT